METDQDVKPTVVVHHVMLELVEPERKDSTANLMLIVYLIGMVFGLIVARYVYSAEVKV